MGLLRTLALCSLVALVEAAPADAAITASTISSPASGSELFFDGDSGSGGVTVRGTVTGAGAGASGDLLCYTVGDTKSFRLAAGIDVSSGSFATSASLLPIAGFACRLALVPSGRTPTGDAAAVFAGPAVSVSDRFSHSSSGNLDGYFILSGTLPWSFALQSVGECPINSSFATDPSTLGSFSLFAGNSCLGQSSGVGAAAGTRSALMVNGLNAYTPGALKDLTSTAGFEPLSYSPTFGANHDTVSITESDTPMICDPPASFPPTTSSCPGLHDSGLQIQQTTTLLPGGQVARVTQRFTSVDGKAHSVDALFSQSVAGQASDQTPGFQFPTQTSFATHSAPYSFATFPPGPGSIIAISDANGRLPTTSNPIGAITYNRPPLSADFVTAPGAQTATFVMHYADTVPPGGSVVYDWSYSQAASSTSLATLEQIERDRFGNPLVVIGIPRNNTVTRKPVVRVQGQTLDAVGITDLTVGGHGVVVRPGGVFGTDVRLKVGRNIIVASATNLAGNRTTAAVVVTYKLPLCRVPKLLGKMLGQARSAIKRSHCRVGRLEHVRSRRLAQGRVIATKPRAGTTHRYGYKVRLIVSTGR